MSTGRISVSLAALVATAVIPATTSVRAEASAHQPSSATAVAPGNWERGTNLVTFLADGYRQADDGALGQSVLDALRTQQGTGTIVLTPTDYVDSSHPAGIIREWNPYGTVKNESDASVREVACAARTGGERGYGGPGGFSVALKPHIDQTDRSFRGHIDPHGASLESFWAQYRQLILEQARLAIEIHARTLVVGTELTALSDDPADEARWRKLIAAVRRVRGERFGCWGPGGEQPIGKRVKFAKAGIKLTYAANWDAIDRVHFWDALDMIGTDFYADGAGMGHVRRTVTKIEARLKRRGAGTRPFLFTEIGYDGARDPAGYGQGSPDANQSAMYASAFRNWIEAQRRGAAPWFRGFWWWDRYAQGGADSTWMRDDFTPGPQAMAVQCRFQCTPPSP